MALSKVRLFVDHPLAPEQSVELEKDQAHYLFGVMRLELGSEITLINGRDGAFTAEVTDAGKRRGQLRIGVQTQELVMPPDLWLMFAPIKKARTDFIVEKATEMGARRILPVSTDFTNSDRIRQDRLQAHAIEATEQCGGTYVPEVCALSKLTDMLANWDPERKILFCDETLAGEAMTRALPESEKWAIVIGPEGGFSQAERDRLKALAYAHPIALGPRILRADTAAVAALTYWQMQAGDWR